MTDRILIHSPGKGRSHRTAAEDVDHTSAVSSVWRVARVAGAVLALVGWTDVVLLWYPLNVGNPEWEFATVGATYDALPLATIGSAALTIAALGRRSRRALRALGAWFVIVSLVLVGAYVLYLLSAAVAWKSVTPEYRFVLHRALGKCSSQAVLYVLLYGWLARLTLRTRSS